MDATELHDDDFVTTFASSSDTQNATLFIVLGIGAIGLALVSFAVIVGKDLGQLQLHTTTTLPMVGGLALIARGVMLRQSPRSITLSPEAIEIDKASDTTTIPWSNIGWAAKGQGALSHATELKLFDRNGKTLHVISNTLTDFDQLSELVIDRVGRKADETTNTIKKKKSHKQGLFLILGGCFGIALASFMIWDTHNDQEGAKLLASSGILGEAEIVERRMAPNGVTCRLIYKVTGNNGQTSERNVMVTQLYWDATAEATHVAVTYVPDRPDLSKLAVGEVDEKKDILDSPKARYTMSGIIIVMCVVFIVAGILNFLGWDIDFNNKTGKFSFVRFGEGT